MTFVGLFILESGGYAPVSSGKIGSGNSTSHSSHFGNDLDLSSQSIAHIRGLHCFFPAVCVAIAGLCLYAYPLNKLEHMNIVKAIAALEAPPVVVEIGQDPTPPANDINLSVHPAVEKQLSYSSSEVAACVGRLEEDAAPQPSDYPETPSEQVSNLET